MCQKTTRALRDIIFLAHKIRTGISVFCLHPNETARYLNELQHLINWLVNVDATLRNLRQGNHNGCLYTRLASVRRELRMIWIELDSILMDLNRHLTTFDITEDELRNECSRQVENG